MNTTTASTTAATEAAAEATTESTDDTAVWRMLITYLLSAPARLELMPMGSWITLRGVNRTLAAAYHTARAMFPEYLRQRLLELVTESVAAVLLAADCTYTGDFIVDCVWGLHRPLSSPVIIVIIADWRVNRLLEHPDITTVHDDNNAVVTCYHYARTPYTAYVDRRVMRRGTVMGGVGSIDHPIINIKIIRPFGLYEYDDLVNGVVDSFPWRCCRVAYVPARGLAVETPMGSGVVLPVRASRLYVADGVGELGRLEYGPHLPHNVWLVSYAGPARGSITAATLALREFYADAGLIERE